MQLLYFDTETTGLDSSAHLVQLAYKTSKTGHSMSAYFKPPLPVSYGSMAIHHITEKMLVDKPIFEGSEAQAELVALLTDHIPVAHNAPFDIQILRNDGVTVGSHIDTLRLARHLVQSEQYGLQYLRYFLNLETEGVAHDAHGDVLVLEALFKHLETLTKEQFALSTEDEVLEKLLELTQTPVLMRTFSFGKHINKSFEEVCRSDRSYLEWLYGSESKKDKLEQNEDLLYTLNHYLR